MCVELRGPADSHSFLFRFVSFFFTHIHGFYSWFFSLSFAFSLVHSIFQFKLNADWINGQMKNKIVLKTAHKRFGKLERSENACDLWRFLLSMRCHWSRFLSPISIQLRTNKAFADAVAFEFWLLNH